MAALKNLWVRDSSGVWRQVKEVYFMSETGSWSASFRQLWLQNYQYSATHPSLDWRRVFDSGAGSTPAPTVPPTNLSLTNGLLYKTTLTWSLTGSFSTRIYYQVVDAAGVEQDSGLSNRIVTVSGTSSDAQTWDSTIYSNGWRIRAQAQQFSDGGNGPWSAWTSSVVLRP